MVAIYSAVRTCRHEVPGIYLTHVLMFLCLALVV